MFKQRVTRCQGSRRLDQCTLPTSVLSRSKIKALILNGLATVDGVTILDPSFRMQEGQEVVIVLPSDFPSTSIAVLPEPQEIQLDIVYEDEDLIIVDKPAGMVVHPSPGHPNTTLVNALLAHCGNSLGKVGETNRPGIVHRLDKGTSGLLVAAKTRRAYSALREQFSIHHVERVYEALVFGNLSPLTGTVNNSIGRHPHDRKRMAIIKAGGKSATTHYQVKKMFDRVASLVECRPLTGRMHQIRLHMLSLGHPIIGDPVYNKRRSRDRSVLKGVSPVINTVSSFSHQALHARSIGFQHPVTGNRLFFEKQIPADIQELVNFLETIQTFPYT